MEALNNLATILNATLEHVPPHTRSILMAQAQQAIKDLESALKKADGQGN